MGNTQPRPPELYTNAAGLHVQVSLHTSTPTHTAGFSKSRKRLAVLWRALALPTLPWRRYPSSRRSLHRPPLAERAPASVMRNTLTHATTAWTILGRVLISPPRPALAPPGPPKLNPSR